MDDYEHITVYLEPDAFGSDEDDEQDQAGLARVAEIAADMIKANHPDAVVSVEVGNTLSDATYLTGDDEEIRQIFNAAWEAFVDEQERQAAQTAILTRRRVLAQPVRHEAGRVRRDMLSVIRCKLACGHTVQEHGVDGQADAIYVAKSYDCPECRDEQNVRSFERIGLTEVKILDVFRD